MVVREDNEVVGITEVVVIVVSIKVVGVGVGVGDGVVIEQLVELKTGIRVVTGD